MPTPIHELKANHHPKCLVPDGDLVGIQCIELHAMSAHSGVAQKSLLKLAAAIGDNALAKLLAGSLKTDQTQIAAIGHRRAADHFVVPVVDRRSSNLRYRCAPTSLSQSEE